MSTRMSKVEALAHQIVQALSTVTEGRPQAWRSTTALTEAIEGAEAAVQFAAGKGWLEIEGGHSICLTDEGRQVAKH